MGSAGPARKALDVDVCMYIYVHTHMYTYPKKQDIIFIKATSGANAYYYYSLAAQLLCNTFKRHCNYISCKSFSI